MPDVQRGCLAAGLLQLGDDGDTDGRGDETQDGDHHHDFDESHSAVAAALLPLLFRIHDCSSPHVTF
jgi:hypothetical protein